MSTLDAIRLATRHAGGIAELGLPPRTPLLADWFKEGDPGFLFAPRGLGKTWLSMGIGSNVVLPWLAKRSARRLRFSTLDGCRDCGNETQRATQEHQKRESAGTMVPDAFAAPNTPLTDSKTTLIAQQLMTSTPNHVSAGL